MINWILNIIETWKNDPVRKCELYKKEGCSHVDGLLCDYHNCSMLKEYLKETI